MTEIRISGVSDGLKDDILQVSRRTGLTMSGYLKMKLREIVDYDKRVAAEKPRYPFPKS